jgi:hypothetical protein
MMPFLSLNFQEQINGGQAVDSTQSFEEALRTDANSHSTQSDVTSARLIPTTK